MNGKIARNSKKSDVADGWIRADILYRQFPGLSREVSNVSTKFDGGSIFFNSTQMAEYITKKY